MPYLTLICGQGMNSQPPSTSFQHLDLHLHGLSSEVSRETSCDHYPGFDHRHICLKSRHATWHAVFVNSFASNSGSKRPHTSTSRIVSLWLRFRIATSPLAIPSRSPGSSLVSTSQDFTLRSFPSPARSRSDFEFEMLPPKFQDSHGGSTVFNPTAGRWLLVIH